MEAEVWHVVIIVEAIMKILMNDLTNKSKKKKGVTFEYLDQCGALKN